MALVDLRTQIVADIARTDVDLPAIVTGAINYAHLKLMRQHNFQCMDTQSAQFDFPIGAKSIPMPVAVADLKQAKVLYLIDQSTQAKPLKKMSEDQWNQEILEVEPIDLDDNQDILIPPKNNIFLPYTSWELRWYMGRGNLYLTPGPLAVDVTLMLGYYRYLPPYVLDADTDWFMDNAYDVLESGALGRTYQILNEFQLASAFRSDFADGMAQLIEEDAYARIAGENLVKGG